MCKVLQGAAHTGKHNNYHSTQHFLPSALEHFSVFQLIVLAFLTSLVFSAADPTHIQYLPSTKQYSHSGAFSSWRARYFPQEVVKTKTKVKAGVILNLKFIKWPQTWWPCFVSAGSVHLTHTYYYLALLVVKNSTRHLYCDVSVVYKA